MYLYHLEIFRHDEDYYYPEYTLLHQRKYSQKEFMEIVKTLTNKILQSHDTMTIIERFDKILLKELEKLGFHPFIKNKWSAEVCISFVSRDVLGNAPNTLFVDIKKPGKVMGKCP